MNPLKSILDTIKTLWADNKVKAILLALPIIAIGVLKVAAWLVKRSADNTMADAQDQDKKLSEDVQKAQDEANKHKANADSLANQDPEVDENWNKKK